MHDLSEAQYHAALAAAEDPSATAEERAEMLMEIAAGIQARPRSTQPIHHAIALYERALLIAPVAAVLLRARIQARLGTALQALPDGDGTGLARALDQLGAALPTLEGHGKPEEAAETLLNIGLVQQALVSSGRARIQDAIASYHRALRTFTSAAYPQEYALLHNNLAIAYLSIPAVDESGRMREALAVQSFEEVLRVINLVDHPSEYAMIQNNLGNALQYATSGHALENNLRALAAYDEALKVRTAQHMPMEYANTIANKANVLRNLPRGSRQAPGDDTRPAALLLYREAEALYRNHGETERAALVAGYATEIESELSGEGMPGH